jgi:hypothetical protein
MKSLFRKGQSEKGVRLHLPERPEGCFAQMEPDPFFGLHLPERPEGCFAQMEPDPFFGLTLQGTDEAETGSEDGCRPAACGP